MIETKLGLGGYVTNIRFIDKNGNSFRPKEFSNDDPIYNRIVDAGLDMPASHYWADCFTVGSVGTGTSGTSDSMTTLESYSSHSNTYPNSSALNGYEIDLDSITKSIKLFRTFTISANSSGSSVFISEIGVGNEDASNPAIFARILLPTSIEWEDGLEFQFTYNLRINYPSITNNPQPKTIQIWDGVGFVGIDGNECISMSYDRHGMFQVSSDGTTESSSSLFVDVNSSVSTGNNSVRGGVIENGTDSSIFGEYYCLSYDLSLKTGNAYKEAYIAGSKYIVRKFEYDSDVASMLDIISFSIGDYYGYTQPYVNIGREDDLRNGAGYMFIADSAFTKQVGRKFTVTQTLSWDRV